MSTRPGLPLPLPLIVVDGIGALIFALGAAGHFGNVGVLMALLPGVPQIDLLAMLAGGVLMAFAMIGIVRAALRRAREQRAAMATPAQGATQSQPGLARPSGVSGRR
jgi:hypothetical protein